MRRHWIYRNGWDVFSALHLPIGSGIISLRISCLISTPEMSLATLMNSTTYQFCGLQIQLIAISPLILHRRLGHAGVSNIESLIKKANVQDVLTGPTEDFHCEPFHLAKSKLLISQDPQPRQSSLGNSFALTSRQSNQLESQSTDTHWWTTYTIHLFITFEGRRRRWTHWTQWGISI